MLFATAHTFMCEDQPFRPESSTIVDAVQLEDGKGNDLSESLNTSKGPDTVGWN